MLGCTFVPPAIAVATLKSAWWVSQAWIEARKCIFFSSAEVRSNFTIKFSGTGKEILF